MFSENIVFIDVSTSLLNPNNNKNIKNNSNNDDKNKSKNKYNNKMIK